jgi:hypothetical protein
MNTLQVKSHQNLHFLLNLEHDDNINAKRGELALQDDFVQVDNIIDLEYAIYFTFHELLTSTELSAIYNTDLIDKMDQCIDTIFDNKQLNELIENDEEFKNIIDTIDEKIYQLKESYFYQSPFFSFFRKCYNNYNSMKQIFIKNNEYISKMFYQSNREITADDLDFKFDSDSEQDNEKEEKNEETGEVNPNLIYDDDTKDYKKEN